LKCGEEYLGAMNYDSLKYYVDEKRKRIANNNNKNNNDFDD
jgi:hypothetical protein